MTCKGVGAESEPEQEKSLRLSQHLINQLGRQEKSAKKKKIYQKEEKTIKA